MREAIAEQRTLQDMRARIPHNVTPPKQKKKKEKEAAWRTLRPYLRKNYRRNSYTIATHRLAGVGGWGV